jgi:glycerophosphoryl diester phosphodiesterase
LIDLNDAAQVRERRPLLIAHRGGVITERSPECSLAAIELAAESGYSMVELDVQSSLDGVPIVFHDRSLLTVCGRLGRTSDYSASELLTFVYTGTSQKILSLEIALRKCRALGLGVMLDLKHGREDAPFLDRVDQLIMRCQLTTAAVSISGSVEAREQLKHIMFTPTNGQMSRFNRGENVDLKGTFWFGLPRDLSSTDVARLKACGAYVFPAINTFRYPKEGHRELARKDIKRLVSDGVDGFQIDSIYSDLVTR